MRGIRWIAAGLAGLTGLALGGCGDRPGSENAARALTEAIYPGEFNYYDSYLQKGHYDVAFVKKGDPLTRMRFAVDADPARCKIGTACEERLRRAYASAVAGGIKLKALNSAFSKCGVPMLGLHDARAAPAFRLIVELNLDPANQQPALDRLTPCITAFRLALPADAADPVKSLALHILRPGKGQVAEQKPMDLDSRLPDERVDEASYVIAIAPDQNQALAENLHLYVHYISRSGLNDELANVARRALAADPLGGHVPNHPLNWQLKLDPQRLDVIRTYLLVCSEQTPGKGPCRTDVAVRMRYDLNTGDASELAIIRDIRESPGSVALPDLPGR